MKLEDIGFYTLSNERARKTSVISPIMRAELILTDRCNFRCPYCRGLRKDLCGDMSFPLAQEHLSLLFSRNCLDVCVAYNNEAEKIDGN